MARKSANQRRPGNNPHAVVLKYLSIIKGLVIALATLVAAVSGLLAVITRT
jgi:hypothetical protein